MISLMDEDKSGTLTRLEIEENYKKLPNNSSEWDYFKKMFRSLNNIFPSFALSE
jgi:Ca2+-binding EF-hand superfamily protein